MPRVVHVAAAEGRIYAFANRHDIITVQAPAERVGVPAGRPYWSFGPLTV
jgi:hypothetical protein